MIGITKADVVGLLGGIWRAGYLQKLIYHTDCIISLSDFLKCSTYVL